MAIYQRIKARERCHELCVAVYGATESWPGTERFGLTSQARRAAHSAAANIAEGCAKKGSKARDLKILSQQEWGRLDEIHRRAGGMTWLLYKSQLVKKATVPTTR